VNLGMGSNKSAAVRREDGEAGEAWAVGSLAFGAPCSPDPLVKLSFHLASGLMDITTRRGCMHIGRLNMC